MSVSPSIALRAEQSLREAGTRPQGRPDGLGPELRLLYKEGARLYVLPRGVVVQEVERDLHSCLNATVKVGAHRFLVVMSPRGEQHIKLHPDQPDWDDAVDALHAAEGC